MPDTKHLKMYERIRRDLIQGKQNKNRFGRSSGSRLRLWPPRRRLPLSTMSTRWVSPGSAPRKRERPISGPSWVGGGSDTAGGLSTRIRGTGGWDMSSVGGCDAWAGEAGPDDPRVHVLARLGRCRRVEGKFGRPRLKRGVFGLSFSGISPSVL